MSYSRTDWKTGDIITAEKLNKIEKGISDTSSNSAGSVSLSVIDGTVEIEDSTFSANLTSLDFIGKYISALVIHRATNVYEFAMYKITTVSAGIDNPGYDEDKILLACSNGLKFMYTISTGSIEYIGSTSIDILWPTT